MRIQDSIRFHLLITGQTNDAFVTRRHFVQAFACHGRHLRIGHKSKRFDRRILLIGYRLRFVFTGACRTVLTRLIRNHEVGIDVCFYVPRRVHRR